MNTMSIRTRYRPIRIHLDMTGLRSIEEANASRDDKTFGLGRRSDQRRPQSRLDGISVQTVSVVRPTS
jgi:hypothetical protein